MASKSLIKTKLANICNVNESGETEDVVNKVNCKLCQCEFRLEVEELFEKGQSILSICKFLNTKGVIIAYPSIRNHLLYHYLSPIKSRALQEYADDVSGWIDSKRDRDDELQIQIAMLNRKLFHIELAVEDKDIDTVLRSSKISTEIIQTINDLEDKRKALSDDMKPIEVVINNLSNIIANQIKNATSTETREALKTIVSELKKSVSHMNV